MGVCRSRSWSTAMRSRCRKKGRSSSGRMKKSSSKEKIIHRSKETISSNIKGRRKTGGGGRTEARVGEGVFERTETEAGIGVRYLVDAAAVVFR